MGFVANGDNGSMALNLSIAAVVSRSRVSAFGEALDLFRGRIAPFATIELPTWDTEAGLLEGVLKQKSRTPPLLVMLDSRGKNMSSEAFAGWLGRERDGGRQSIVFAIGPASGWSNEARGEADLLLSMGPMTLPHELARLVLIEQVYRAFTILTGHPYHTGH